MQDTLGPAVHQPRLSRRSHVLLHHVHERIGQSAGDLTLRKRVKRLRIENREDRVVAVEGVFLLRLVARDHRSAVHLGACGGHRQHRGQRHRLRVAALEDQLPGIPLVEQSGRDELRTVDHRTAAHSQQEVNLLLLAQSDGFAKGLDRRVGLDPPEFDEITTRKGLDNLVVDPVPLDAAAAEGDHDPLVSRDELRQTGDLAFAEDQFGRILIDEVVHVEKSFDSTKITNPGELSHSARKFS